MKEVRLKKPSCVFCSYEYYTQCLNQDVSKLIFTVKGRKNKAHIKLVPDKYVAYGELYIMWRGEYVGKWLHGKIK